MAEKKIVIDIEVNNREASETVNDTIDSLGRLRRELAQLNAQSEDVEKGSEAFKRLQTEIKKTERDIKKAEGAFGDATDRIRTLSGSGVERATASFGLLREGITNLDFGKFKIGVQGVAGSFKALGSAIAATGIGLLVIGISQLIANFDELKSSGGLLGEVLTFIGNQVSFILDAIEDLADSIGLIDKEEQRNAAAREARSKKFIEDEQNKVGAVESRYNKEIALAKSLGQSTDELEVKSLKAQKAVIDNQIERIKAFQETSSLFDSVLGPILEKLEKDQEQVNLNIQVKENEILTKRNESYQKFLNERKTFFDKFITETEFEQIERQEAEAIKEAERLKASEEEKFRIREFFLNKRTDLLLKQTEADFIQQQKETETQTKKAEEDLEFEEEYNKMVAEARERRIKNNEAANQREIIADEELRQKKVDAVFNGLSTISSLTELFAGKSEAAQRKAFNIQKGVSIAETAIATYESATKSYNSLAEIPVVGPVLGGIAAAAAVAAGLANIRKIASQKFEGGGATAPSTPTTNTSSLNIGNSVGSSTNQVVPSSFSLFGTAGAANNLGGNQPQMIQAFVSESDISSVQRRLNRFRTASEL